MRILLFYFIALLLISSCNDAGKEESLVVRERNLEVKEKEFAAKEADYLQLLVMRDSINNSATEVPIETGLPENLIGSWTGKMICTESNCSEHVIGDQRTDVYEFTRDGLRMINKTGGERLFTGKVSGTELKLISDSTASIASFSEIILSLNDVDKGRLKGNRKLMGKNDCIAQFSVDLEKAKN